MLLAAAAGHRVILVCATDGSVGEVDEDFLLAGETLAERRAQELIEAGRILGVHRLDQLGYKDSGMMGTHTNADPGCFWQADVEEAAARLAAILIEERVDVLTCYDSHGGYGHPDHIQVHRVGHRASHLAGVGRVYESTMNRTEVVRLMNAAAQGGVDIGDTPDAAQQEGFGTPEDELTTAVDVSSVLEAKRQVMAVHASQIGEESIFLSLPDDLFKDAFGTEWFIRTDTIPVGLETDLFEGLAT
jgi:LmbE family N-acetylglucosaminyl deacetylase